MAIALEKPKLKMKPEHPKSFNAPTLREVIRDLVKSGLTPPQVASQIIKEYEPKWLLKQLNVREQVQEMARSYTRNLRNDVRKGERRASKETPEEMGQRLELERKIFQRFVDDLTTHVENFRTAIVVEFLAMMEKQRHIPGVGWKLQSELTADECELIAAGLQKQAKTEAVEAELLIEAAGLMRSKKARRLGDIEEELAGFLQLPST